MIEDSFPHTGKGQKFRPFLPFWEDFEQTSFILFTKRFNYLPFYARLFALVGIIFYTLFAFQQISNINLNIFSQHLAILNTLLRHCCQKH